MQGPPFALVRGVILEKFPSKHASLEISSQNDERIVTNEHVERNVEIG